MTEAIYLEVTEKAEAARKAKRRVSVSDRRFQRNGIIRCKIYR